MVTYWNKYSANNLHKQLEKVLGKLLELLFYLFILTYISQLLNVFQGV